MARVKRKLVIVSNRGPYRAQTSAGKRVLVRAAGGLVAALDKNVIDPRPLLAGKALFGGGVAGR